MTTTERQPLIYQVAHPSLVCRADLLDAQAFEVEVEYGDTFEHDGEEYFEYVGTVTVVVAALDQASADAMFPEHIPYFEGMELLQLDFKTV